MIAKILSSAVIGIDAYLVEVEVDISPGLPMVAMVGLPEASVKESRDRVKTAIVNSGYSFPDDRITVNLAPANIKKDGTGFDLPVALGILTVMGLIPADMVEGYLVLGELSLDGRVKPVNGSLPMAIEARRAGYKGIVVPRDNAREASVVQDLPVYPVSRLQEVVDFFRGLATIPPQPGYEASEERDGLADAGDFSEVMGQEHVKRALEVAAAGGHNLLMIGPPGSGKTMLARRIPSILPPMTFEEAIETTKIFSVVGLLNQDAPLVLERPFRAPHHTISDAGLIGGGHVPRPGEVSLAHNGVLFLDELPEFKKHVLEVLRQPLEDMTVTISRATTSLTYPASFMLVAAMNPCPCGYFTDSVHECRCSPQQIDKYRGRISGPLMDRIDLHVEVPAVSYRELTATSGGEPSSRIRERVMAARDRQTRRFAKTSIHRNAQMSSRHIKSWCRTDATSENLLETAVHRLGLSARAYNRILKIARTIADLDGADAIGESHVAEAIQYRGMDRTQQRR